MAKDFADLAEEIKAQRTEITNLRLANATALKAEEARALAERLTELRTDVNWLRWAVRGLLGGAVVEILVYFFAHKS